MGGCSTQREAGELILGPSLAAKTRLLSFDRIQSRIVTELLTGHNTLRRHLHFIGLTNNPLCRRCGAEDETSAHILWLHSDMYIWAPFSWIQRTLRVLSLGTI